MSKLGGMGPSTLFRLSTERVSVFASPPAATAAIAAAQAQTQAQAQATRSTAAEVKVDVEGVDVEGTELELTEARATIDEGRLSVNPIVIAHGVNV